MKIAVSSYSFSQAMRDGRMTIMDVIPKAKEMGYEGVEIVRGGWSDEEMRAMAPKLKAQSEEYGMPIIAYMVGADFIRNGLDARPKSPRCWARRACATIPPAAATRTTTPCPWKRRCRSWPRAIAA